MRLLMNMALIMIEPSARGVCVVSATEQGDKLVLDVEGSVPDEDHRCHGHTLESRRNLGWAP
mgnify:CR=1 FL=1